MLETNRPEWFSEAMTSLLANVSLRTELVQEVFRNLLTGTVPEPFSAAFLTALRMKGENSEEIATAARVLREKMVRLIPPGDVVLDTCGTGGDESGTFNISTATAFVVAGVGVPVVKHGNRAVSSRSGSADVLSRLGIAIELGPEWSQRCLDEIGFSFCYAPHFHSGMKHVASLRRALGYRTIFNLLGPLANPALANYQMIGVGRAELLDPIAGAVALLNIKRAAIVHSVDGLDEVSLNSPTHVRLVEGNTIREAIWTADDFGLEPVALDAIRVTDATGSAAIIQELLNNTHGGARRIVLANAAAALWVCGRSTTLREGITQAEMALESGRAKTILEQLTQMR